MVDHGDFVVEDFRIGLIGEKSFFENGLIVEVEGKAGGVINARALKATRFDFKHLIVAVAILVDPSSDRIALIGRLEKLGPVAAVGEDATIVMLGVDQNISGIRRDNEFQRP